MMVMMMKEREMRKREGDVQKTSTRFLRDRHTTHAQTTTNERGKLYDEDGDDGEEAAEKSRRVKAHTQLGDVYGGQGWKNNRTHSTGQYRMCAHVIQTDRRRRRRRRHRRERDIKHWLQTKRAMAVTIIVNERAILTTNNLDALYDS